jgi:hypothetical protein
MSGKSGEVVEWMSKDEEPLPDSMHVFLGASAKMSEG